MKSLRLKKLPKEKLISSNPYLDKTYTGSFIKLFITLFILGIIIFYTYKLLSIDKPINILLDQYVNTPIHEFGHHFINFFLPFIPFISNETKKVIGASFGTVFQVGFPLTFFIAFLFKRKIIPAIFALWWIGETLIYTHWYVLDALCFCILDNEQSHNPWNLGGVGIHDMAYIFTQLNIMDKAEVIGNGIYIYSKITMISSIIVILILSFYTFFKEIYNIIRINSKNKAENNDKIYLK